MWRAFYFYGEIFLGALVVREICCPLRTLVLRFSAMLPYRIDGALVGMATCMLDWIDYPIALRNPTPL